jgi:hypothetical protein
VKVEWRLKDKAYENCTSMYKEDLMEGAMKSCQKMKRSERRARSMHEGTERRQVRGFTFQTSAPNSADFAKDVNKREGEPMPAERRAVDMAKGTVLITPLDISAALMSGNKLRRASGTDDE